MRTRRLELMRPEEIVAAREAAPVAYLPVGPLEWHGPHLPLGVDPLVAHAVALATADLTGGVVAPPLYLGTDVMHSPETLRDFGFDGDEQIVGMDFPGNSVRSMYADEDVFAATVRHLAEMLADRDWELIALISGHGGENQVAALKRIADEITGAGAARVLYCQAWLDTSGHADATETSLMMHLQPESVELNALPPADELLRNVDWAIIDGPTFAGRPNESRTVEADPRALSSAAAGAAQMQAIVSRIVNQIGEALEVNPS